MDAVLNWLWQGCIVALALTAMLGLLEHARAHVRFLVCWVALLIVCALPLLPLLTSASMPQAGATFAVGPVVSVPRDWWSSQAVLIAAWSCWVAVFGTRLAIALAGLRRARRQGRDVPAAVETALPCWTRLRDQGRRTQIVLSEPVKSAAVLGCGSPVIAVAPSLVHRLDSVELDRVIVHEWAHVQRRDDLTNVLQLAIRAIAGWHPAVWWIDRRLQHEREIACDEMAVAITGSPKAYATCLVKIAEISHGGRAPLPVPGVLAAGGLRHRVARILSRRDLMSSLRSRRVAVAIVGMLATLAAASSGISLVEMAAVVTHAIEAPAALRSDASEAMRPPSAVQVPSSPAQRRTTAREGEPRAGAQTTPVTDRAETPRIPAPDPGRVTAPAPSSTVESSEPSLPSAPPAQAPIDTVAPDVQRLELDVQPVEIPAPPPWSRAAEAGVAVGRGAKDAGVATAGLFTKFAARVAGAF